MRGLILGGRQGPIFSRSEVRSMSSGSSDSRRRECVYPCTCTRADVARAASAPHAEDEGPVYPGSCSGRSVADAESMRDRTFAWRFRVPSGTIEWDDLFLGHVTGDPARLGGDFIVARSDGSYSYQLAVVADDAAMGVSQVIRGNDLLASTPRQILLYRQAGLPEPAFGHVPLAIDAEGRRLAKRDSSFKLATLRGAGLILESSSVRSFIRAAGRERLWR